MDNFSKWLINEAISASAVNQVNKIVLSYLSKKLKTKVYCYPALEQFVNSTGRGYGVRYFYKNKSIRFNWKGANVSSFTLDSVDIWDGKSRDATWHLQFDEQQSLVKTLPLIVSFLLGKIKAGTTYLIPDDVNEDIDFEGTTQLNEAKDDDPFELALKWLKPNVAFSRYQIYQKDGNKTRTIMKKIQESYPDLFNSNGRSTIFVGTEADIRQIANQKDKIIKSSGGVKVTVTPGGSGEKYLPSKQEQEIEEEGIEKIAYEDQLKHLAILIKMLVKGATNALFIAGRGGTGKALPNETKVLMADNSWKAIKDITIGEKVKTWDGSESEVTGVYPQGMRDILSFQFEDKRYIECDKEHLWEVITNNRTKVMSAQNIQNLIQNKKFYIPLYDEIFLAPSALPYTPWLIGYLLSQNIQIEENSISLLIKDEYIKNKIEKLIPYYPTLSFSIDDFGNAIISCDQELIDLVSNNKIPDTYKSVAKSLRIELVQGFLDGNGWQTNKGDYLFSASNELIDELQKVVWSIGGKCLKSINKLKRDIRRKEENLFIFSYKHNLITNPKRREAIKNVNNNDGLLIENIKELGQKECTCIKISDPRGLFVVQDYIVTHNTQTVETELAAAGLRDGSGYFKNTGSASPIGIYTTLYDNKDGVVLFDDCDSALNDQEGRNLIKAATDTKKIRKIAWNKKSGIIIPAKQYEEMIEKGDGERPATKDGTYYYPNNFEFSGRIIFISNLKIDKLDPDGAIRTRGFLIEIDPSNGEMIDYMAKIAPKIKLENGVVLKQSEIDEVINEIKKSKKQADISLRKLVRGLNIRAELGDDESWKTILRLYA